MVEKKQNETVDASRRRFLGASGAAALAASTGGAVIVSAASEAAAQSGAGAIGMSYSAFKVGELEVFTFLDGAVTVPEPQGIFGMNVSPEAFAAASEANFIPADQTKFFFTPTLVRSGDEVVLFDSGVGVDGLPARGNLNASLGAIGLTADDITTVVITHMHPDHIGGMGVEGAPTYPNAKIVTGAVEYDFWSALEPETNGVTQLFNAGVKPFAERTTFIKGGDSVAPGITAVEAFGHTPGHMNFMVESNGQQLHIAADLANHYVWSVAYPGWEVRFDMDKEAAAAKRRELLGMIAADRIPFVGYHMPFPSVGYLEPGTGDAEFRYVPASYQLSL